MRPLVFLLLCSVPTVALADNTLLFSFDPTFDTGKLKLNDGAKAAIVKSGTGHALRVETGQSDGFPGVELAAPGGHWDLSKHALLELDVKNVGAASFKVECRVDCPPAGDGTVVRTSKGVNLSPGQAGTIKVELARSLPWVKVELFGMKGYPWGTAKAIDPSSIVNLVVFTSQPNEPQAFEITSIRAVGRYTPPTDLLKDDKFFPFIDEYGQYIHSDWPGKTHSAEDLARSLNAERSDLDANPGPENWDKYGGWQNGPALKSTGWFYAAKHDGKWWLVDPDGKLFFSNGIDCVTPYEGLTPVDERDRWFRNLPSSDGEFKNCYWANHASMHGHYQGRKPRCFDFGQANLIRKYGKDWKDSYSTISHRRLRSWGINTIGNWSDAEIYLQHKTPYVVNASFSSKQLEGSSGFWGKFKDVFDEDFARKARESMASRSSKTSADPWCIGYFVDNEIEWGSDDVFLASATLASPASQAAKKAFVEDLKNKYGDISKLNQAWNTGHASWDELLNSVQPPDERKAHDDLAAFQARTAERYFKTIRDAVKEYAPHQLYLGCRFANINAPAYALKAAAKYCDVVSYNIYSPSAALFRLPSGTDAPVIIGEFMFGALDRGMLHPGLVPVENQERRGQAYYEYVQGVLENPQFVGCHWFKYADQATTGRPLDEENYQTGFLDIADTPYEEMVQASRRLSSRLYDIRSRK